MTQKIVRVEDTDVAYDAGHGGKDTGAKGLKGILEKKVNRNVVDFLLKMAADAGWNAMNVRVNDAYMAINDRTKKINAAGLPPTVSVHHNAGGGDGFEIIYQMNKPKSKELALMIKDEFEKLNNYRRVFCQPSTAHPNKDYFGILRDVRGIAVITEFAFLDSPDVEEVDTLTEQKGESQAIHNAMVRYRKKYPKG